ncbi:hypothetical protein BKA69DRAFT_1060296 [Paraphysoderma sedebokerense]|nr:hypothetical protein BKA69DRAFT_1060296 [Paraphysoderma sedebokerense]
MFYIHHLSPPISLQSFESRKRKYIDDYDLNDPFVDDSEMYLDDVGLVKPKHDGFFAFTGDLEVIAADASYAISFLLLIDGFC